MGDIGIRMDPLVKLGSEEELEAPIDSPFRKR